MKITQINNDELEIKESGTGGIIAGVLVAVVGVGVAVVPLLSSGVEWWVSLIGIAVIGLGALFALTAAHKRIVLRKNGTSEVTTTKILTRKVTSQTFTTDQVASIGLETRTSYEREVSSGASTREGSSRVRTSVLYVQLRDNSQIVLASRRSGGSVSVGGIDMSGFGKAPLSDEASRIAAFLGVPLNAQSTGEVGIEAIGQVIGAIRQSAAGAQQPVATNANAASLSPAAPAQPQSPQATPAAPSQDQLSQ